MDLKECQGLAQQLRMCYGLNREADPAHKVKLRITSLTSDGPVRKTLQSLNASRWGPTTECEQASQWHVGLCEGDYESEAAKEQQLRGSAMEIVYLTADAVEELEELDAEGCIYVIGGLLDHNRLKRATFERAISRGIRTARLPISRFVSIQRRPILTVNHVFHLLLTYSATRDWPSTLLSVLPPRMEASLVGEGHSEPHQPLDSLSEDHSEDLPE